MSVPICDNTQALPVYIVDGTGTTTSSTTGTVGSATPTTATVVAGTDGTNSRVLKTDTTGRLTLDPTNPGAVKNLGGSNLATGQVAVTTSATLVVAARTGRQKVTITSTAATVFYVGTAAVTTANGLYVAGNAGASVTLDTAAAVYAIGASAVTLSYVELY